MVVEILFIVTMAVWFFAGFPYPALAPYAPARHFLAFAAVLLLGLYVFIPALRGS